MPVRDQLGWLRLTRLALLVVTPVAVYAAATGRFFGPATYLALTVALGGAVVAMAAPAAAARVFLVMIISIPIYWGVQRSGIPYPLIPGIVLPVVLIPAAAQHASRHRPRITRLDVYVIVHVGLVVLSEFLYFPSSPIIAGYYILQALVPYAVFRCLTVDAAVRTRLAAAVVWVATVLSLVGLGERTGLGNPFFTLVTPRFAARTWVGAQSRFGSIRAEASFGHAIPFGMFLAAAFVLALALAWVPKGRRYLLVLPLIAAAQLATASRGAVVVTVVAAAVWLASLREHLHPRRVTTMVLALMCLLAFTPAGSAIRDLRDSISAPGEAGEAVTYRVTVSRLLTNGRNFSWLGSPSPIPDPSGVAGRRAGLPSIDSQYSLVFLAHGLLPLVALVLIGFSCVVTALRTSGDPIDRAWAAVAAASFVGIASVALITQYVAWFWITLGICGSINAGIREEPIEELGGSTSDVVPIERRQRRPTVRG